MSVRTEVPLPEQLRDHAEPRGRVWGPAISGGTPDGTQAHIAADVLIAAAARIEELEAGVGKYVKEMRHYLATEDHEGNATTFGKLARLIA